MGETDRAESSHGFLGRLISGEVRVLKGFGRSHGLLLLGWEVFRRDESHAVLIGLRSLTIIFRLLALEPQSRLMKRRHESKEDHSA